MPPENRPTSQPTSEPEILQPIQPESTMQFPQTAAPTPPPQSRKKLIMVLVIVCAVLVSGILTAFLLIKKPTSTNTATQNSSYEAFMDENFSVQLPEGFTYEKSDDTITIHLSGSSVPANIEDAFSSIEITNLKLGPEGKNVGAKDALDALEAGGAANSIQPLSSLEKAKSTSVKRQTFKGFDAAVAEAQLERGGEIVGTVKTVSFTTEDDIYEVSIHAYNKDHKFLSAVDAIIDSFQDKPS